MGSGNNNRDNWDQENFEALKKTSSQFIPLIRFMEISCADFYIKVHPYKIFTKKVEESYHKDTLPKTITLSPRIGKILKPESTIIKPRLAHIIANWIKRCSFI